MRVCDITRQPGEIVEVRFSVNDETSLGWEMEVGPEALAALNNRDWATLAQLGGGTVVEAAPAAAPVRKARKPRQPAPAPPGGNASALDAALAGTPAGEGFVKATHAGVQVWERAAVGEPEGVQA